MKKVAAFSVATVGILALSLDARAQLTLPFSGSCSTGSNCFEIWSNTVSGTGIRGNGNHRGVLGETPNGYGVVGLANGTSGTGVSGSSGSSGIGVHGTAGLYGVVGQTALGRGVVGIGTQSGVGVYGESLSGYGGQFKTSATGPNIAALRAEAPAGGTAIFASNPGGTAGWFEGNVFAGAYGSTSDGRLKKDVGDLSYGLGQLLELRPVAFRWKRDDGRIHLGLIAQDVEKIVPDVVSRTPDPLGAEVMTINYTELVPILIKAVQQQNRTLVEQENRIAALERARPPLKLSSMIGGGVLGLVSLGLVLASRHRKGQHGPDSREPG